MEQLNVEKVCHLFQNFWSGKLTVGSRTPLADTPAWMTLEVFRGGFATGRLMAGGALQPHEEDLIKSHDLAAPPQSCSAATDRRVKSEPDRTQLNMWHLTEPGMQRMRAMLESGRFSISAPEEGALLCFVWLWDNGREEAAGQLLDTLQPYFHRVRFYPALSDVPYGYTETVFRVSCSQLRQQLANRRDKIEVRTQAEAVRVWIPFEARIRAFFAGFEDASRIDREAAKKILVEFDALKAKHVLCKRRHRPEGTIGRMIRALSELATNKPGSGLSSETLGKLKAALSNTSSKTPEQLARRKATNEHKASLPLLSEVAPILARRIPALDRCGVEDVEFVTRPIEQEEIGVGEPFIKAGMQIPSQLKKKVHMAKQASLEVLLSEGLIPSAEVLAQLAVQLIACSQPKYLPDAASGRLYAAIEEAFSKRRSLLLLHYAHQVRITELPWLSVFQTLMQASIASQPQQSHPLLLQLANICLTQFAGSIVPNKMLPILRNLASMSNMKLELLEETAADIFMGSFTDKFLRAAKHAAEELEGTLYARYYGLPKPHTMIDMTMEGLLPARSQNHGYVSQDMSKRRYSSAYNGAIIEQMMVLTTHNLLPLARLANLTEDAYLASAKRCLRQVASLLKSVGSGHAALIRVKTAAYAWRQMIFFLSFCPASRQVAFLAEMGPEWQGQLKTIYLGLEVAINYARPVVQKNVFSNGGQVFYGWVHGRRHWLIQEEDKPPRRLPCPIQYQYLYEEDDEEDDDEDDGDDEDDIY